MWHAAAPPNPSLFIRDPSYPYAYYYPYGVVLPHPPPPAPKSSTPKRGRDNSDPIASVMLSAGLDPGGQSQKPQPKQKGTEIQPRDRPLPQNWECPLCNWQFGTRRRKTDHLRRHIKRLFEGAEMPTEFLSSRIIRKYPAATVHRPVCLNCKSLILTRRTMAQHAEKHNSCIEICFPVLTEMEKEYLLIKRNAQPPESQNAQSVASVDETPIKEEVQERSEFDPVPIGESSKPQKEKKLRLATSLYHGYETERTKELEEMLAQTTPARADSIRRVNRNNSAK